MEPAATALWMKRRAWFTRLPALSRWGLDGPQTATLAGVLLITAVVYLRSLGDGFVWDDHAEIVDNLYLRQWSFLWKSLVRDCWWFRDPNHLPQSAYYRPVQMLWFFAGYHLFGLHAVAWRAARVPVHLIAVLLSFRIAQLLTADTSVGLLCSILFGLLPANAETVVWSVSEPFLVLFEFAAFYCFLGRTDGRRHHFAWSLLLYAGAILSNESAVIFPLLIAGYAFLLGRRGPPAANEPAPDGRQPPALSLIERVHAAVGVALPFLAVAVGYLTLRLWVLGVDNFMGVPHWRTVAAVINGRLVVHQVPRGHTPLQILATVPGVMLGYLRLVSMPWLAGPAYRVHFVVQPNLWNFYAPLLTLAVLAAAGYAAIRQSPQRNLYLFCAAWFVLNLLPAMNFDHVVALIQDRYVSLSALGFCIVVADCTIRLARSGAMLRLAVEASAAMALAVSAVALWNVQRYWHDDVTLFTRCVQVLPDSAHYRLMLQMYLAQRGDLEGAERQMRCANALEPDHEDWHRDFASLYRKMGRSEDALREQRLSFLLNHPILAMGKLPAPNPDEPSCKALLDTRR